MRKKKGLFFGVIVFAVAAFLYFMPLQLADLASGDELLEIVGRDEGMDGEDYLLDYDPAMYQGCGDYHYSLFTMADNRPTPVQWNDVSFDLAFGSPPHRDFDAEAVAAFLEEVNGLLADSTL